MELDTNLGLALGHLEQILSENCYTYLLSVLTETEEELKLRDGNEPRPAEAGGRGSRPSQKWKSDLLSSLGVRGSSVPVLPINLSSLKEARGSSVGNDILCSRLPVCKKFLHRRVSEESGNSKSSSLILRRRDSKAELKKSELTPIIGKIAYPETVPFILPSKNPKPKIGKGVCEMHQSISNPLYKDYNHEGYVKSEDELGRDLISQFTQAFNTWLDSLEGDKVQVEPELFVKIMRQDLEAPEPGLLEHVDTFLYTFPKLQI